jgi:hypothetical protein
MLVNDRNREIYDAVTAQIASRHLGVGTEGVSRGAIEINDWSFSIGLEASRDGHRHGVYIKIPKDEICRKEIFPITAGAARLARDEFEALRHLAGHWPDDDLRVCFVKPLEFLADYNAIVTRRAYGAPLFAAFRHRDLLAHMGVRSASDGIKEALHRLGRALSRYHAGTATPAPWHGYDLAQKMRGLTTELCCLGLPAPLKARLEPAFAAIERLDSAIQICPTLKGLDVRNILIAEDGALHILDPGKLKLDAAEADVARFVMTCRLLYWGSPLFGLRLSPAARYEDSFLAGYYGDRPPAGPLFRLYLLKEQLKSLRMAYHALRNKRWGTAVKGVFKSCYIEPFFHRSLSRELSRLEFA